MHKSFHKTSIVIIIYRLLGYLKQNSKLFSLLFVCVVILSILSFWHAKVVGAILLIALDNNNALFLFFVGFIYISFRHC